MGQRSLPELADMRASRARRVCATVVDVVAAYLIAGFGGGAAMVFLVVLGASGVIREDWTKNISAMGPPLLIAIAAGSGVYLLVSDAIDGASFGKTIVGLRVRTLELELPSLKVAAIRALALLPEVVPIGVPALLSISRSPIGQRMGDRWAGTFVTRDAEVSARAGLPPPSQLKGALAGAFAGAIVNFALVLGWFLTR